MPRPALLALLLALTGAAPATADEVVVFAAASVKTALDRVAQSFEAETGHRVVISYAGSGALARQILQGAPADVFVSAATDWMDQVDQAGLIAPGQRADLFGNRLVLIAHGPAAAPVAITPDLDLTARLGDGFLAMALTEAVPAGQYGKAALQALNLWDGIAGRVAQADNVRAALALVAAGEAPLGIVYATDAAASDQVSVIGTFPEGSHPPIVYPAARLATGTDPGDAAFFDALMSDMGKAAFAAEGFTLLQP